MKEFFPHSAQTGDVIVRVSVSFLPEQSEPGKGRWFWAYHIRIENEGAKPVQLVSRYPIRATVARVTARLEPQVPRHEWSAETVGSLPGALDSRN